jgi:hypothetical protein
MISANEPNKALLDSLFRDKIPLLVRDKDKIWIYGIDSVGDIKLTLSLKPEIYASLPFTETPGPSKEITNEIYTDINTSEAHFQVIYINIHDVIVRNSGKLPAKNVRLGHAFLPDYIVIPNTKYEVTNLAAGGKDISFPVLVPYEQITVSYLYYAPTTYQSINTYVKSDEGLAKVINVIQAPSYSQWQKAIIYVLLFIGSWTSVYLVIIFLISMSNILIFCR